MSRRYRPLGAFRLLLALMVVLQHFQHLLRPEQRVFFAQPGRGAVAVAVFFVISGFVVDEANEVFYRGRPLAFMGNRLVRVVPPYLAALVLIVLVHALLWRARRLVLWDYTLHLSPLDPRLLLSGLLGLLPGFRTSLVAQDFEFIPFVWSLRMEMAFYLAACAALLAARYWARAVPAFLLAGAVASAVFLARMRPGLLSTAPMFLLGVAAYLVLQHRTRWRLALAALACGLAAAGFLSWQQHGTPQAVAQFAMLAVLLLAFLMLSAAVAGDAVSAWDRRLGDLTYPLYLNHYAVGLAAFNLTQRRGAELYSACIVASILLAWLMARLTEAPLGRIRDRIRRSRL